MNGAASPDDRGARHLVAALRRRSDGHRRIPLRDVMRVFAKLWPDAIRQPDARTQLEALLRTAAATELVTPSIKLDRSGLPALPAFVTLPAENKSVSVPKRNVVWNVAIAWAHELRLNNRHHEMLLSVNRWLRDSGSSRPVVPAEERSLELFNDEKAIGKRVGGKTLWGPGRLSLDLLRCEATITPFVWEAVGSGSWLLVVENQATFRSLTRVLRGMDRTHRYGGVVWGQGNMARDRIGYLVDLPFQVDKLQYFGDLDVPGLETAYATCDVASGLEIPAGPHRRLWQLLLQQCPVPNGKPPDVGRLAKAIKWLPVDLQDHACHVLRSGQRIPQERVGFEMLSEDVTWLG